MLSIARKITVGTRSGRGNESLAFGLVASSTTTLIFPAMLIRMAIVSVVLCACGSNATNAVAADTIAADTIATGDSRWRMLEASIDAGQLSLKQDPDFAAADIKVWCHDLGGNWLTIAINPVQKILWIDANRDSQIQRDERIRFDKDQLLQTVVLSVAGKDSSSHRYDIPIALRYEPLLDVWLVASMLQQAGKTDFSGVDVDYLIRDEDCDGQLSGSADSLQIDLNGDHQYDPIRERFSLSKIFRHDGKQYAVALDIDTANMKVREVSDFGKLSIQFTSTTDAMKAPTRFTAVLVSDLGIRVTASSFDTILTVPTGDYRLDSAVLWWDDTPKWRMIFSRFDDSGITCKVAKDEEATIELLGRVTLGAKTNAIKNEVSTTITLSPHFKSTSGLYLTHAGTGHNAATIDVPLRAFAWTKNDDGRSRVIAIGTSGFACGTFCPVPMNLAKHNVTSITLTFDAGPLGGKLNGELPGFLLRPHAKE